MKTTHLVIGLAALGAAAFWMYEQKKSEDHAKLSGGKPPPPPPSKPSGSGGGVGGFLASLDPTTSAAKAGQVLGGTIRNVGGNLLSGLFS